MRKTVSDTTAPGAPWTPPQRGDFRAALLTGAAALLLYVATLAPTVTGEDSGELIGAAYTLGVPHPPGYPVWTMLAHSFTWIPIGSIAWRVNLFSAVCGAGTIALLALIGMGLTQRRGAAILGALCFALSRVFWEHALFAEVYTLSTLFIALLLYRCLGCATTERPAHHYLTALLIGVSTGVHSTLVLLAPFWLLMLLVQAPVALRRKPSYYFLMGLSSLVGTLVYVYLPLASLQNPAVDWGDPETLSRWWDVVRRVQYAFMVDQYPRNATRFLGQSLTMAQYWFRDFAGLGALLSVVGTGILLRRRPLLTAYLVTMALTTVGAVIYMQNFEQDREWLWVMRVFLLPLEFFSAVALIAAFAWLGAGSRNLRGFVWGLGIALLFASLLAHSNVSKRNYYYAEDYARNILATLPPDAIYISVGDHQTFPVLYLQVAESMRDDVTLLRKYGYLDLEAVPGLAAYGEAHWGHFPKRRFDGEIVNWLLKNTNRPLFLHPQEATQGIDASIVPVGLLLQALRPGEAAHRTSLERLAWQRPLPDMPATDYTLSLIQFDCASAQARMAFEAGDRAGALEAVAAAAKYGHRAPVILHNLGVLCARNRAYDAAAGYFEEILQADPNHAAAQAKLKRIRRLIDGGGP